MIPVWITLKANPITPELEPKEVYRGRPTTEFLSLAVPQKGEAVIYNGERYVVDQVEWDFDDMQSVGLGGRAPKVTVYVWKP